MASNADLITSINEINPEAKTEGLNNVALAKLLKELKAPEAAAAPAAPAAPEAPAAPAAPAAPEAPAAPAAPEAPAAVKKKGYVIAPGKAITSKRGILGEGDACSAADFSGDISTFNTLKKKGFIV